MVNRKLIREAIRNPRKALKVAPYRFDVFIGKILFKNTAGFTKNVDGAVTQTKFKKTQSKSMMKEQENPLVSEFRTQGHTKLGCIYDPSLIERIAWKFDKIIEDEKISHPVSTAIYDGKVYSREVPLIHKHIPEITNLIDKNVIDFFEQYYGGPFKILDLNAYRIYHIPNDIAERQYFYSNDWHCDGQNTTWIKLFVYLTDVSDDDAPFNAQSIKRTKELLKMGFGDRTNPKLSKEILEDPAYSIRYTGSKGTTLVCNTELCLHRATIPAKGHFRDLVMFVFAPSTEPLSDNWTSSLKGST